MNTTPDDLLAGETVILSKNANAIITVDEQGLSRFAFDQLMWTVGMQGKEAIGGRLHLTNFRLIFKSHAINRLTGKFSILLPTIQEVKDVSRFLTKKIEIVTKTQHFEFVVWGIPELIAAITAAKTKLTAEQIQSLRANAAADYQKLGDGLQVFRAIEALNRSFLTADDLTKVAAVAENRIQGSTVLNLMELLSQQTAPPPS
jgi:hypothetical protein